MRAHLEHARYVFVAHDDGLKFPIRPPVHPELSRPAPSRPHPTRARQSVGRSIHPRPHFTLDARAPRSSASVAVAPPLIASDTPPVETPRARTRLKKKTEKDRISGKRPKTKIWNLRPPPPPPRDESRSVMPSRAFSPFRPPRAAHLSLKVVSETPIERAASVAGSDTRAKSSSSPNSRPCARWCVGTVVDEG